MTIRLGYEIRTGRPVDVPLAHTAVTGQTQQSGKTTTLEALVHRSGKRAIAFVTKRGEGSFRDAKPIPPYFRDGADWQFVSSILEALMGERMKFERSYIINACKNARGLADVHENIKLPLYGKRNPNHGHKEKGKPRDNREWLVKPATGFNEGILTNLCAYFDIVIPQIERLPYTDKLDLHKGLNVMDLSDYTTELQSLVIRSVLKWVYEHESNTIVIIPEAWEFIPQNRRSPVLLAAEELIRKGAAEGNFMWLDSQDIAAVHKSVLRSVGVWILGVQREANEIKRMLAHIPRPAPGATDVMTLGKGQFYACFRDQMRKVYVQPFWVSDAHAESVARGDEDIASVEKIWNEKQRERKAPAVDSEADAETDASDPVPDAAQPHRGSDETQSSQGSQAGPPAEDDEIMWKEKFEELQSEYEKLRQRLSTLEMTSVERKADYMAIPREGSGRESIADSGGIVGTKYSLNAKGWFTLLDAETAAGVVAWLQSHPALIELLRERPTLKVTVRRPTLNLDDSTMKGKIATLIADGFFALPRSVVDVQKELNRRGCKTPTTNIYAPIDKLSADGCLIVENKNYQISPNLKIETVEA